MQFKEVPFESLVINQKYKIMYQDGYAYVIATLQSIDKKILLFTNMCYIFQETTGQEYNIRYKHYIINKKNLTRTMFYRPNNKELVQLSMEKRALDKILKKLVDEHFEWF
jgi:hypothetical protein